MFKRSYAIIIVLILSLTMSSCQSQSETDLYKLTDILNHDYGYELREDSFIAEKKENNIIYHTMIDNNTLLTLYSNKNKTIIQCTLSCFNTNYSEIFIIISSILTKNDIESIKAAITNAEKYGEFEQNGWKYIIISNQLGKTYIINKINSESNPVTKPTLKSSD